MATIHRVIVDLINVASDGTVIHKNDPSTTLAMLKNFSTEHRIIGPTTGAASSANAADYPTVNEYLAAEAADGFLVAHIDQYFIVTQKA